MMSLDSDAESLLAILNRSVEEEPDFHHFPLLHEDLQIFILSFISEAPFEDPQKPSPLTNVLPYVSKQVRVMCLSDYLWRMALERLVKKDPFLWVQGLLKLHMCDSSSPHFVRSVHEGLHEPGYFSVFRLVVERYLRFTGPVFMMSGVVHLGEPIGLHFFEPRYRLLIRQVMDGYNVDDHSGFVLQRNGEYPTFVYAHVAPFAPTSPACLVEVRQCTIHPNRSADVMLMPVAYTRIERLWEAPNTGRLHFAQCLRMGQEDSQALEERVNHRRELFDNPLIEALLQRGNAPEEMRAMLAYLVNDHGGMDQGDGGDDAEDDIGMPAD
jgi:hypothetical protein